MCICHGSLHFGMDSSLKTLHLGIMDMEDSSSMLVISIIPDACGLTCLYSLGNWPIKVGRTKTTHTVYLSEEAHFDVVLGRSFWEARQVKVDPLDPTDVVCGDTGEKIDCELVILKDGKGQIVTVT